MPEERKAIVLHGPAAVGKSTIWAEIQRRCGCKAAFVNLDDGWGGPTELRGNPNTRYMDLRNATAQILVIEIGCGEPGNLAYYGATRAAAEWIGILQTAGRTIYPFLLKVEWPEALKRIEERARQRGIGALWHGAGVWHLYDQKHPFHTFPTLPGFAEASIDTTGREIKSVVDEILQKSGVM